MKMSQVQMNYKESNAENVIEHQSFARIGLLGNPSDMYYGRTITFTIGNFWASVKLEPSNRYLNIKHHPVHDLVHDLVQFDSIDHLFKSGKNGANNGGVRLLLSICKVFRKHCTDNNIELHQINFTLSYETNIPRQTGLSGSSAIVCATLRCLIDFYRVSHKIKLEERPYIILEAEEALGISAGLQDRVAQVYEGRLVHMDFRKEHMDAAGHKHGVYTMLDIDFLPPLHLIYANNPSDSGKVHSTVNDKWKAGDEFIRETMEKVAELADQGRIALLNKDYPKLMELMDRNFDLRRSMFGDECLGEMNIKMVEVARSVGAAAKFTGSGGAVVVYCPKGESQVNSLNEECNKLGFMVEPVQLALN